MFNNSQFGAGTPAGGLTYEFGAFRLEVASRRLLRNGDLVALTGRTFDTLANLVEHAGRVVDKDELMRWVWPDAVVEESNLSQQIFLLRKILGEGPKDHRFIATVPRRGYRFVAAVTRLNEPEELPLRLTLSLPPKAPIALGACPPFAISPDGRVLAYAARDADGPSLYVRPLNRVEPVRVDRTEGASAPFFSPDGRWIGYFARGKLFKVPAAGGSPIGLCEAGSECRGASWSRLDTIVFAPTPASNLSIVSADGGAPRPATSLDYSRGERTHRWPHVLPNGSDVLFTVAHAGSASFDAGEIAIASLETGQRQVLINHGSCARYVPTGHLVYMRGGSIMAVPFDLERRQVAGLAIPVVEGVMTQPTGAGQFAFSDNGCLMYLTGAAQDVRRRLVWVDTRGAIETLPIREQAIEEPRLTPDESRIAFGVRGTTNDIWVYDLAEPAAKRVTFEGDNFAPIWTPDGLRLTFSSNRNGPCHIYWQSTDALDPQLLVGGDFDLVPGSWSPDGSVLLFTEYNPRTGAGVWMCTPMDGGAPQPVTRSLHNDFSPAFAPDGRSFAYTSDESGRLEVYLAPFPATGTKIQISTGGGAEPVWSPAGDGLYFRSGSGVVFVNVDLEGPRVTGASTPVVDGPYQTGAIAGLPNYDVTRDGRLLLIAQTAAQTQPDELSVTINWFVDLRNRMA